MSPRSAQVLPFDAAARATARAAGLRYVSDAQPGITRHGQHKRFTYRDSRGHKLTRAADLARIRALAIPPAWTDVWICPHDLGHIQALFH